MLLNNINFKRKQRVIYEGEENLMFFLIEINHNYPKGDTNKYMAKCYIKNERLLSGTFKMFHGRHTECGLSWICHEVVM